jgi:hypothetical protein
MSPWVNDTLLLVGAWVGLAGLSTGSMAVASLRWDRAKAIARARQIHRND